MRQRSSYVDLVHRLRGARTLGVLVAALAVVGALAVQAYRTEQDHRATAERALREYAGFAAWEFASRAREELWLAMTELLRPAEQLEPRAAGAALPSPAILLAQHRHVAACDCALDIPASYYFRVDLGDSALTTVAADAGDGREPDAAERQWLRDTIAGHARTVFEKRWRVATVVGSVNGAGLTVGYTVVRDTGGRPVAAYGVVAPSTSFMAAVSATIDLTSLVPPALTHRGDTARLVSIAVHDEQGRTIYGTPWQHGPHLAATSPLTRFASGFSVEASLAPLAADRLILGGTARRFPLLLALLAITAALVAIAVRQLRREAALARLRAEFVAGVSHELRTPLSQIRMFAELLRLGWVRSDEERTRALQIIDQEARRLGHLVDTALHFDRTGREDAVPAAAGAATPVDAGLVAAETAESFAPLVRARGVAVSVVLDDEEALTAAIDRDALRQVLLNLLDNAAKYGPAGGRIEVAASRLPDSDVVRLTVEDEGPGIPAAERGRVFEPYVRLSRGGETGSGIGLSVVRRLVESHGGAVRVEDGARGGARFVVELPAMERGGVAGVSCERDHARGEDRARIERDAPRDGMMPAGATAGRTFDIGGGPPHRDAGWSPAGDPSPARGAAVGAGA